MNNDEIKIKMGEDDWFDVIINNELLVHIKRNDVGYSVDLYKNSTEEEMSEDDYDFDGDFISGCTAWDDDLEDENGLED